MNETLKVNTWIAGESFSLADVGLVPYVNRLDMLNMSGIWSGGRLPEVENWFERVKALPSFKPAFLDWCPEDLTRELHTFGTQSWEEVKAILKL